MMEFNVHVVEAHFVEKEKVNNVLTQGEIAFLLTVDKLVNTSVILIIKH